MSKTIFLDFDGVLHPSSSIAGMGGRVTQQQIDARGLFRWVHHLEDLIEAAPAAVKNDLCIAVHSSWRLLPGLDQSLIRDNLGKLGAYYIGMTNPDLNRWDSILEMCSRAEFDDYLVIDDAYLEFPSGLDKLVVCAPLTGLSDPELTRQIGDWLNADQHRNIALPDLTY